MNLSAISGVLVTVVAALWVVIFIPSWFENTQNKSEVRTVKREVQTQVKQIRNEAKPKMVTESSIIASALYRNSTVRKFLAFAILVSASVLVWAILDFSNNSVAAYLSAAALVVCTLANRRSQVVKRELLARSLQVSKHVKSSVPAMFKYVDDLSQVVADQEARVWIPVDLPKPMHLLNKVGELETPVLAQVKSITPTVVNAVDSTGSQQVESEISLDEILRRRRAI